MTDAKTILFLGATGTAGGGAVRACLRAGHTVHSVVRPGRALDEIELGTAQIQEADVTDAAALAALLQAKGPFHAIVSCLASRTGTPRDAWAIDYQVHSDLLKAAQAAGVPQFVLLSAICVQKPTLAFQKAKLAFEAELVASGLTYSIVRPTAFFKSLSGQIEKVKAGKPFLVFGDGRLTACKPISDDDLGDYIAACLADPALQNRILPIGGPGPALTPLDQAAMLGEVLGQEVKVRHVPVGIMGAIRGVARTLGLVSGAMAEKAELVKIGKYYATESMLVWDEKAGRYDADATPEYGRETLRDHYRAVAEGRAKVDLGEHAMF